MIEKWQTVHKKHLGDFRVFNAFSVDRIHPIHHHTSSFIVLDAPVWVNILPINTKGEVVLVRQYRHGLDDITLEFPGGVVEPGEDPCEAAMRECLEETGFMSPKRAELLGMQRPNPAWLSNHCMSYVWFDCENAAEQELDRNEDIEVVRIPLDEMAHAIRRGEIQHSLVLSAWTLYQLHFGHFSLADHGGSVR